MEYEILYKPSYALAKITLNPGESIVAEAGAMVSMSDGIEIETAARGGLLGSLRRSVLGGESFFQNTFNASRGGEVTLAPPLPGDIVHLRLKGETVMVQSGSYPASSPASRLTRSGVGQGRSSPKRASSCCGCRAPATCS